MEQLVLVSQDGQGVQHSLPLTDYADYFVTSRRGFAAPPVQVFSERLPDVAGTRYTGTVVRERRLSFALDVRATSYEAAWARVTALGPLVQNALYLASTMNGHERRLGVRYSSGLEDIDTGRWRGAWPKLALTFTAPAPYWYDPLPQTLVVDMAADALNLQWPFAFPFTLTTDGSSLQATITAGDAPSDWQLDLLGPFTSLRVSRLADGAYLEVAGGAVLAGQMVTIRTAAAERRVLLDDGLGITNITGRLTAGARWWQLQPGANAVAVQVTGGSGNNRGYWRWVNRYLAPG